MNKLIGLTLAMGSVVPFCLMLLNGMFGTETDNVMQDIVYAVRFYGAGIWSAVMFGLGCVCFCLPTPQTK